MLLEPSIYLSASQREVVARKFPSLAGYKLPAWVPHRLIARDLHHGSEGIMRGLRMTGGVPYLWATEFENVHDLWRYNEPSLLIGWINYRSSEDYFHESKPSPFNQDEWNLIRDDVMRVAIRAKFLADPHLRSLLRATVGYPLVSIKSDAYWGVNPHEGGRNRLAELWTELRDEEC